MRYFLIILLTVTSLSGFGRQKPFTYKFDKSRIVAGDSVTLSWQAPKRFDVQIEGFDSVFGNTGSIKLPLIEKQRLTLVASKGKTTITRRTRALKIIYPEFNYFMAERNARNPEEILLQWNALNYRRLSIEGIEESLGPSGSLKIMSTEEETFKLMAESWTGEVYVRYAKAPKDMTLKRDYIKGLMPFEANSDINFFMEIVSVDVSGYPDLVELKVLAFDNNGHYITGLAPPYGPLERSQQIFSRLFVTDIHGQSLVPFNVKEIRESEQNKADISFVMDFSGSMSGVMHHFKNIAADFTANKSPVDRMALVAFDHRLYVLGPLTQDSQSLKEAILLNDKLLGGSTALYAACDEGLQLIRYSEREKILLVFTDGYENASFPYYGARATDVNTLSNKIRKSKTKLYIIGYGHMVNHETLQQLSRLSNGRYYYINTIDDLHKVLFEIGFIMKTYYKVTFKPPSSKGPVDIKLVYQNNTGDVIIEDNYFIGDVEHITDTRAPTFSPVIMDSIELVAPPQVIANFQFNKSFIESQFRGPLNSFASYLIKNKNTKVLITGHSDSRGNEKVRQRISKERAESVAAYFTEKGVEPARVTTQYFSYSKPVYPVEEYEWQARENRRVEIILYKEVK